MDAERIFFGAVVTAPEFFPKDRKQNSKIIPAGFRHANNWTWMSVYLRWPRNSPALCFRDGYGQIRSRVKLSAGRVSHINPDARSFRLLREYGAHLLRLRMNT
jgi:hypothetical protein